MKPQDRPATPDVQLAGSVGLYRTNCPQFAATAVAKVFSMTSNAFFIVRTPNYCSPRRKFSSMYSQVRRVKAMIEIVLVLSVAKGKTLASQM